jgi:hypothetical protein
VPYILLIGLFLSVSFWLLHKKYAKFDFTGPRFVLSRAVLFLLAYPVSRTLLGTRLNASAVDLKVV